ncbi:hypothetical protein ABFS83_14G279200 [Erythranthe nasuta]
MTISICTEAECIEVQMLRRASLKVKMDHYGLIVGLDIEKTEKGKKAEDYWILKNSWGIERGYMRLLRNSGRPEGICGVYLFAVYPIKRTDNPPPFQPQLHTHSGDVPSKLLRSPTKCWSCYPCS